MNIGGEIEKLTNWAAALKGGIPGDAASEALRSMTTAWSAQIQRHGDVDSVQFIINDLQQLRDSIGYLQRELQERIELTKAELLDSAQRSDIGAFTMAYNKGATVEQLKQDIFLDVAVQAAEASGRTAVVRFILDKRFDGVEILTFDTMVGLGYSVERSVVCVKSLVSELQGCATRAYELPAFL
jgi:hypothetical protein